MYNQFCKNLNYYMNIISDTEGNSARKQIAEIILPLADINSYLKDKHENNLYYRKVSNLIYNISQFSDAYPSIRKFIMELWAYGFDIEESQESEIEADNLREAAKLIDLLMSTHYFA